MPAVTGLSGNITTVYLLPYDVSGGLDDASLRAAIGMAAANFDTQLAAVAKTGADGDTLKVISDQLDSLPGAIGEYLLEDTYSRDDVLRIIAAVLAGKTSGSGTHSIEITGIDGETTRVTGQLDGAGNRTSMVLNAEQSSP